MKKKNGFTLIEIMVVIVIMGVLAAVAIPKMFGLIAKAKVTELLSAAGTYIHLEDAYLHQGHGIGNWSVIGYVPPGNGKTSYFEYGNCFQESAQESESSFIGWYATSLSSFNACTAQNSWGIVITPASQNRAYYTQITSSAECATLSRYWEVGDINVSACTAAATQTAQQDTDDDDQSNKCGTSNGQGAGLEHAYGQQKKCDPDLENPGHSNGNNGNGKKEKGNNGNGKNKNP